MTTVSVVIPSRDRALLLERAVASAIGQVGVDLEVIVVLDGTRDKSAAVVRALGDTRIAVVEHERPLGDAVSRNAGLEAATGAWVAFLDDDDVWSPDKLQLGLRHAGERGFAYAGAAMVDDRWRMIAESPAPPAQGLLPRLLRLNVVPAGASNVMVRRDLLQSLDGFDSSLTHISDWDAWIRLAAATEAAPVPATTVACVFHAGNRSLCDPGAIRRDYERLIAKHAPLARRLGVDLDPVAFDRWVAANQRRAGRRGRAAIAYVRSAAHNRQPADVARAAKTMLSPGLVTRQRPRPPAPEWLAAVSSASRHEPAGGDDGRTAV